MFWRVRDADGPFWDAAARELSRMEPEAASYLASLFSNLVSSRRWLDLLLSQPPSTAHTKALVNVAARVAPANAPGAEAESAAKATWDFAVKIPDEALRDATVFALAQATVAPPHEFFTDAAAAHAWFESLGRVSQAKSRDVFHNVVARVAKSDGPFWDAFANEAVRMTTPVLQGAIQGLQYVQEGPPPRLASRWIEVLRSPEAKALQGGSSQWLALSVAKANDPGFIPLLRDVVLGKTWESNLSPGLLYVLTQYHGPGRLEFALDALGHPQARTFVQQRFLMDLIPSQGGEAQTKEVARIVSERRDDGAAVLLSALSNPQGAAEVVRLAKTEADTATPGSLAYRRALMTAATTLHLKEAVPFLLREFRETGSQEAATAMDAIKAYHQRLASFEAWAKAGGEGGAAKDLASLLSDGDPEIRRAAVLSLGALNERDALPAIVRLAKQDPDARVRQAALQAVERLSK
jgi:hypothetical protein